MRDVVTEGLPDLVGWSASHGHPVFHDIASQDEEGATGTSTCDTHLACIRGPEHIRPFERACLKCWPKGVTGHKPAPARLKAIVRTPLVAPVAPIGPTDLRVTSEGHLAIRGASSDVHHPWLILDMNQPSLLHLVADDQAAVTWPTLRSRWPTEALINGVALADRYEVDRTFVAKWRKDPEFPLVAFTIADRPGWYPETLPAIDRWHRDRPGRIGRPSKDPA